MKRRLQVALGLVCSLCVLESAGFAAGLSRPNMNGARAIGLGGAFTAVADDPTAMWYNPGAPAFFGDNVVYLGGELVLTGREYTPSADSPLGKDGHTQPIKENSDPTFMPMVGASSRVRLRQDQADALRAQHSRVTSATAARSASRAVTSISRRP